MSPDQYSILVAAVLFAGVALYFPRVGPFLQKRRIRPPHRAMSVIFRLWFALLAAASVALLFFTKPHHH